MSHVSEEARLAEILKEHISRDFLGMLDVFVSSDLESIAAGANWLTSLENALRQASALLVLCSHASLNRPWVNFEVGAAWIKSIPIVPVCHSGLRLKELPIPLCLLQGIEATSEGGVKRIYALVAEKLGCRLPPIDLSGLVDELTKFEGDYGPQIRRTFSAEMDKLAGAKSRVYEALSDPDYRWRSIERLAILGGTTEDQVLEFLVQDPNVVFGKGKKAGRRIARLKQREI